MKPYPIVIICAAFLFGCNHANTNNPAQSTSNPQLSTSAPIEPPLLTVGQLRQQMLVYNGKLVRVKALIVDFGDGSVSQSCGQAATFGTKEVDANITSTIWSQAQNTSSGWIIADDLGSYFTASRFAGKSSGHLLVQPASPTVRYLDYVEIEGTYDANASTIQATSIKTTAHYPAGQQH